MIRRPFWIGRPCSPGWSTNISRPAPTTVSPACGVGYTGLFQTLAVWRESAWRNGELLASATTPEARALALQEIETYTATQALAIKTANRYVPPVTTSTSRDTYCAGRNGYPPPMSYAFGTPSAY
jgi:hypothetical protein